MPSRSGLSHAIAAVVVLVVGPIITRFIELLVTARDVTVVMESLAGIVSTHPFVPLQSDFTTTILYVVVISLLAFIWGYAYHVRRHSTSS